MKNLSLALALLAASALPALAADDFVDRASLPAGPFLSDDHDGKLVSTIYMVPLEDLNPDKTFNDLAVPGTTVDHVDIYFNAGHPGVEKPHAHIVLWHVPAADLPSHM